MASIREFVQQTIIQPWVDRLELWTLNRQSQVHQARAEKHLFETALDLGTYVGNRDPYDDGEIWDKLGGGGPGCKDAPFTTERELADIRKQCRRLAYENGYAINGHENRISYIVGCGVKPNVTIKDDAGEYEGTTEAEEPVEKADAARKAAKQQNDALATLCQEVLDDFCEANHWGNRQQEIVRRTDRDGECFLRFFPDDETGLRVRFVEPDQVSTPQRLVSDSSHSFGIQTDPDDVETVMGYWIDGELVPADEMQHRKANVDSNVKRGLPLFYPVRTQIKRSDDINRNLAALIAIQTAIAMIRKRQGATQTGVENLVANAGDLRRTSPVTGRTTYSKKWNAGTIIDTDDRSEYEFPASKIQASGAIDADKHILRSIASRLVMPEFMFTSDASNANYASTMVAEGPAVRKFQRDQHWHLEHDEAIFWRVLQWAADTDRIPVEALERVEIELEPPTLVVQDLAAETAKDTAWYDRQLVSGQTIAQKNGWDFDQEQRNIEEAEETPSGAKFKQAKTLADANLERAKNPQPMPQFGGNQFGGAAQAAMEAMTAAFAGSLTEGGLGAGV